MDGSKSFQTSTKYEYNIKDLEILVKQKVSRESITNEYTLRRHNVLSQQLYETNSPIRCHKTVQLIECEVLFQ